MAQDKQQLKFEEIRSLGTEIIATQMDDFRFHEPFCHSQAELKMRTCV